MKIFAVTFFRETEVLYEVRKCFQFSHSIRIMIKKVQEKQSIGKKSTALLKSYTLQNVLRAHSQKHSLKTVYSVKHILWPSEARR